MHLFENNESASKMTTFQRWRAMYEPNGPPVLKEEYITTEEFPVTADPSLKECFPSLLSETPKYCKLVKFPSNRDHFPKPLHIGCVLSGGQASGGHNVICGIYSYIKKVHPGSQLYGFIGGPEGIYKGRYKELKEETVFFYKNRGGFDMIGSGRHKIESDENKKASLEHCQALKLDGLVVIGGDDSNTNACLLAEYFAKNNCTTKVIGCPKTIDGDLKNEAVEVSFGYDTACKTYSELIGNIAMDIRSTKKYYHFIRLMGRSASHITLECALLTRPTGCFISEEIAEKKLTLKQIVDYLSDIIIKRAADGRNYGLFLVPEGLIEFIDEFNVLISEINDILAKEIDDETKKDVRAVEKAVVSYLSDTVRDAFVRLPQSTREQLLLDRDPHGNVQVAKIETEKLLVEMVSANLAEHSKAGTYTGTFTTQTHYFGYEGRCAFPTNFDCDYCFGLGQTAACLIENGQTGMMSTIKNLAKPRDQWVAGGYPLVSMINMEKRHGKNVPVITKALVDLNGSLYKTFEAARESWAINDFFCQVGPIQFAMPNMDDPPFLCREID
jgi:diphosphate--fructose-6-phosphate 1-phosphotransferase